MNTRLKTILTTTALALSAGTVTAMTGGTTVPSADVSTTGAVFIHVGVGYCSGMLMSPTWVLTARHCVTARDTAFGDSTRELFDIHAAPSGSSAVANAAVYALDPMPRYYAAGWSVSYGADVKSGRAMITAFKHDGRGVDLDFGVDGYAQIAFTDPTLKISMFNDVIRAPGSTTDVIAVGFVWHDTGPDMLVTRFNADGHVVAAPWSTTSPGATVSYDQVPGMATRVIELEGGIVVAGRDTTEDCERWVAVRYDSTGHRDPAFAPFSSLNCGRLRDVVKVGATLIWLGTNKKGSSVLVRTGLNGERIGSEVPVAPGLIGHRLLAHGSGAVWVVGTRSAPLSVAAVRYRLPDLTPDPDWTTGVIAGPAPAEIEVNAAAEDSDGRLVVAGRWKVNKDDRAMLVRFDAHGGPDNNFGQSGVVGTTDESQSAAGLILGPDLGRLVLVGSEGDGVHHDVFIGAYGADTAHPGGDVSYGTSPPQSITKVVFPSDPAVDIAMVQIPAIAGTAVTGVDDQPIVPTGKEKVECYGYGSDDAGHGGALRHGTFTLVKPTGLNVDAEGAVPLHIQHGDSGGGCLVTRAGHVLVRAVISKSGFAAPTKDVDGNMVTRQVLVEPTQFATFVTNTLAGH